MANTSTDMDNAKFLDILFNDEYRSLHIWYDQYSKTIFIGQDGPEGMQFIKLRKRKLNTILKTVEKETKE